MGSSERVAPAFVRLAGHPLRWELLSVLGESDYRVRELAERVGQPQNLVSYHLRLLRDGGLVTATRSSFDGRDSYYHLDLDSCAGAIAETSAALHPALRTGQEMPRRKRPVAVLFVCTGNSARSPIAEALLRHHAADRVRVTSAGTQARPQLHPSAIRVLADRFGLDVGGQEPRHLDTVAGRGFDHLITLCDRAREASREFPTGARRTHWSVAEPTSYPEFRRTAADIDVRVRQLIPAITTR